MRSRERGFRYMVWEQVFDLGRKMGTPPEAMNYLAKAWGEPYYAQGNVALYLGDCAELLSRLDRAAFGLVVTSPPYNIGKDYERRLALGEYLGWCEGWMKLLHSATTETASFWLNLGYVPVPEKGKAVPLPYLLWDRSPWYLIQEVVWNYGAGVAARHSFSPRNEKFLWYVKDERNYMFDLDAVRDPDVKYPRQYKNGRLKVNPLGKNPSDVWTIPKVTSGTGRASKERTPHPAQFPAAVIERIIKACASQDTIVLDPFVGSGTTCAVASRLGRPSIGIDLRSDYLDIAAERVERARTDPEQQSLDLAD
jgi:adenine-specific DNA-methyltransferase